MPILSDLQASKVVAQNKLNFVATYPEWKFPKPNTLSLQAHYKNLDEYDRRKLGFFKLNEAKTGEIFRRVSPRYLDLVLQNLELLFRTVELSDDTDAVHNSEVISLSVKLHTGAIPG